MERITPRLAVGRKATELAAERERQQAKAAAQQQPQTVGQRIRAQVKDMVEAFLPTSSRKRDTEGYARASIVLSKHVYGGTVSPKVIAKRRARNKMARRTRQAQRRHG